MNGGLFLCRGKGPDGARSVLAAKDEAELLGRAQALRMVRTECRAGLLFGKRAKQIASEVAIGTAWFAGSTTGHGDLSISDETTTAAIKPGPPKGHKSPSRKCRRKRFHCPKHPANRQFFYAMAVSLWCTLKKWRKQRDSRRAPLAPAGAALFRAKLRSRESGTGEPARGRFLRAPGQTGAPSGNVTNEYGHV